MAQDINDSGGNSFELDNVTFPTARAKLNTIFDAVRTNNSGTSAPTTQYAGQFWIDTTSTTWTLYIHDGTDDIQFATIDTSANTVNFTDSSLSIQSDPNPTLGANLDLNSNDITGTGNINITGTATVSGDLTVDTDTLYVDSSSNRVGIGTDSPAGDLSVEGTNVEAFFIGTGNSRLQLKAGNSSNSFIEFGDTDDSNVGRFLYAHADNSMRFDVNATEAMRISSNQNIGIKNSIPDTFNQFANALVVGSGSSNSGITIYSGTANDGNLNFADGTSGNSLFAGFLTYDHSEDAMKFFVNYAGSTSPRMTIDSSGNVLVGMTSNSGSVAGIRAQQSGFFSATREGTSVQASAVFQKLTNDGDIVTFQKDGAKIGTIGNQSVDFHIENASGGGNDTGISLQNNAKINPLLNSSLSNNTIDIGSSSYTFKDFYLGGNIYLGGTTSANALDYYEEGTWTPTASSGVTGFTIQEAKFTRIGRIVEVLMYANTPTGTSANQLRVGGLPFSPSSNHFSTGTGDCNTSFKFIRVQGGADEVYFYNDDRSDFLGSNLGAHILFSITYQIQP